MEMKTIDITKQVGQALDKAGFGDDSNNESNISKAGIWDLCDAISSKDNSKFSVEQAKAEMQKRGHK